MHQDLNEILLFLKDNHSEKKWVLGNVLRMNVFAPSHLFDRYLMELIIGEYVHLDHVINDHQSSKFETDSVSFSISEKGYQFINNGGYQYNTAPNLNLKQEC